jgi:endonuclease YncB( thermonuclease family)
MRAFCPLLLSLLALAAPGHAFDAQGPATPAKTRVGTQFDARVVLVADGDTLELIPQGETRQLRIRLEGIDAPEFGEPFHREATRLTRTLLLKQSVRVEGRDVDRYGRLVARVLASGRDTSLALVQAGLACHFTQFANDAVLAEAQSRARATGAGFWATGAAKPRCTGFASASARSGSPASSGETASKRPEGREGGPGAPVARGFRGNVNSRLYHAASCPNANCRNCSRLFASEAEAKMAGFKPAGDCLRAPRFHVSRVPRFEPWNPTWEPRHLGTLEP